ncbi:DUF4270 domain-containing protein [Pedobacter nyackensis]|uniref:DUF4270 domain-containing protein n=1 Tax=Pedobacter nyackensis TaxID=475255 RepID=A0A1W2BJ46_9SPHI|nr:DUF4270 domain-containing protein [Pedobacter nyackensis]SMC72947.1 protein of unknown function [Pedobacter nyackensis]
MKFTKQDLLTMLIGLFLFASCKDSNTIGLDLESGQEIKGTLMDSATVASQTLVDDPTSGVSLVRHPLGFMTDPTFGTSEASLAMAVSIPSNDFKFGKDAVIDSAVLILPYASQFYGDTTTSVYTIDVKQLDKDISKEQKYMTNQTWPATGASIGTFSGKVKPNTKFKITQIVTGKPDTLGTVIPQIRIKLNNTFINTQLIGLADSAKLSRPNKFFEFFKGLKVTSTATGAGGIMFLNYAGTDGNLAIYYKRTNATTPTAKDTVAVNFPIGNNSGPVTTTVNHIHPTALKDQITNSTENITYLQALAGLKNKISFPYLKKFVADLKAKNNPNTKVIVNKAQLVIDLSAGTDVIPFSAAQRLSLYRYDIAGQRANVPDNDNSIQGVYNGDPRALGNEVLFGGYFDSVNKRYIFTITSYIQDLLDGKTEDYGTFLAPSSLTEFNINPSVTSAARSVISKHKKGAAAGEKTLKLNIYYTQIN